MRCLTPSANVAAIPKEANSNAIWPFERILAEIKEINNVFPVPPEALKKYNPT